jgi:xanthine dehydrogenase YagR molybdenum-binding subunit
MDELAYATGIDLVELRVGNDPDVDQASGRPWSGKHLVECYRQGAERFGWHLRPMAPRSTQRNGVQVGWGMATATYPGRRMPAGCRVTTDVDGRVEFASATHEVGTGVRTVMSQVAADATGLPLSSVSFCSGDSLFPAAPYTGASQITATVGAAVEGAGVEWQRRLLAWLAKLDGNLAVTTDSALRIVAGTISSEDGHIRVPVEDALRAGGLDLANELSFSVTSGGGNDAGPVSQSFGAHFCEVEVDEQIGRATVTRWVAVMDCGRVLNPKLARSQVMGGVLFGLGMALLEQVPYDPESARLIGEYYVPTHADVPDFDIAFVDTPDYGLDAVGVGASARSAPAACLPRSPTRSSTPPGSGCATCR